MDVLNQLNLAMAYIEAHIDDDIELADIASVTTYSPYHFGRLFYYIADISLADYLRRRKLSLAAMKLQSNDERIIDLAIQYGYDSADSFSRAFTKQHGVTPSAARHVGVNLAIFPPLTFQIKIKGVEAMNWRIEETEAFEVFGIERWFKNDAPNTVPAFWSECMADGSYERLLEAAGSEQSTATKQRQEDELCIINAVCGYVEAGSDSFPYMIAAVKKPDSKTVGFTVAEIPKTTWAVFRSEKSKEIGKAIPILFNRAYSEWLPNSGYEKVNGPDMEMYYDSADGTYFEEVWIPVVHV